MRAARNGDRQAETRIPHELRKQGLLQGTALAVFLALVHTVNDAITAILGALLPTLQDRFDTGPTVLALIVAVYWVASSVTQPLFGALAEDVGLRLIGALGVVFAAIFLSLLGVAPTLWVVFVLLVIGGMGSAALHPVGTTIAGGSSVRNRTLGVGFFTAGGMLGFALGPLLILYIAWTGRPPRPCRQFCVRCLRDLHKLSAVVACPRPRLRGDRLDDWLDTRRILSCRRRRITTRRVAGPPAG